MAQKIKPNSCEQPIIREEAAPNYSNVYISSSSVSCSSLERDDENEEHGEEGSRINYPQDLLGVSWGSYLHSGPPTRAGLNESSSQDTSKTLKADSKLSSKEHTISDPPSDIVIAQLTDTTTTTVQGILRHIPANEMAKSTHSDKTVKLLVEDTSSKHTEKKRNEALLLKVHDLVKSLTDCKVELEKYGLETVPIATSLLSALQVKDQSDIPKSSKEDNGSAPIPDKVLNDVIEYLKGLVRLLAKQGKKLNEQALFLQRTGKQLGRNHQSILEEQAMLELASERAQEQLKKETVEHKFIYE